MSVYLDASLRFVCLPLLLGYDYQRVSLVRGVRPLAEVHEGLVSRADGLSIIEVILDAVSQIVGHNRPFFKQHTTSRTIHIYTKPWKKHTLLNKYIVIEHLNSTRSNFPHSCFHHDMPLPRQLLICPRNIDQSVLPPLTPVVGDPGSCERDVSARHGEVDASVEAAGDGEVIHSRRRPASVDGGSNGRLRSEAGVADVHVRQH